MKTDELREKYLSFFEAKGCIRRPSDVLVPNDPTVLFTPAGMNQFKNEFLGIGNLEFTRATTCQKCLRTGDIGNVGVTAYHHTFFEMLGNFSFGDYFKKEAISWAWEFLTDSNWLGIDGERLTITVYQDDDEAYNIWKDDIGVPESRIRRDDEYENFWPAGAPTAGPDGVCGPCSEIYYTPPGSDEEVEIWNLVFTQFNRVGSPPDNLRPLPKQNIDTGMGLERTAAVLQGVKSNFEIDSLRPLCVAAAKAIGKDYSFDAPHGRAVRRIADHVRAVTMCIHEGVLPGNEKQGYIVRQLLRRASLEGFLLGTQKPFLNSLVSTVVGLLSAPYPDLKETIGTVSEAILEEEKQFLAVIERGLKRFQECAESTKGEGSKIFSGEDAFDLHQTDGFLIELTEEMATQQGMTVDHVRFKELMDLHRKKSGSSAFSDSVMVAGPLDAIRNEHGDTTFLGYDQLESTGRVLGIIADQKLVEQLEPGASQNEIAILLDQTPFYAESGGQVGDTGELLAEGVQFKVTNTQKDGNLWLHIGQLKKGTLTQGAEVTAHVNAVRRAGIQRAHSATHILHHALQQTLGDRAAQRGSKVQQDELRFDFSHRSAVTADELQKIENEINARIAEGATIDINMMDLVDARKEGAMALFGEKYPDRVRVVAMGEFSKELCGGTHLSNTGQVGMFKLIVEEPVAKGVRRISAYTGPRAVERIRETEELLKQIQMQLKVPRAEDVPKRIVGLQEELKATKEALAKFTREAISGSVDQLLDAADVVDGVTVVAHLVTEGDRDSLREFADQLRKKRDSIAILVGMEIDGRVALTAAISRPLIKQGLSASDCVKAAAKIVGGGGGGRPDLAEAGGQNPAKLQEALEAGALYYVEQLKK